MELAIASIDSIAASVTVKQAVVTVAEAAAAADQAKREQTNKKLEFLSLLASSSSSRLKSLVCEILVLSFFCCSIPRLLL